MKKYSSSEIARMPWCKKGTVGLHIVTTFTDMEEAGRFLRPLHMALPCGWELSDTINSLASTEPPWPLEMFTNILGARRVFIAHIHKGAVTITLPVDLYADACEADFVVVCDAVVEPMYY